MVWVDSRSHGAGGQLAKQCQSLQRIRGSNGLDPLDNDRSLILSVTNPLLPRILCSVIILILLERRIARRPLKRRFYTASKFGINLLWRKANIFLGKIALLVSQSTEVMKNLIQ